MKLFSKDGSYLHTTIKFKGKTWNLIGCQDNGKIEDTYDEFKSNDGEYVTLMRKQFAKGFMDGKIKL